MAAGRVVLVSDTHLSRRAPQAQENWNAVLRYVEEAAPDAVIHVGDLSLDGAHESEDLRHAHQQLRHLHVPWHAVPGNHDVGDNPFPGAPGGSGVAADRLQRWLDVVGSDRWSLTVGGWSLLAINAQLIGSGLEAEAEQWAWLEQQVSDRGDDALALITHKPVTASDAELAGAPPYRFVPPAGRQRLAELFAGKQLELVISGHVHQYRVLRLGGGTDHLWVPTTWAVLPDRVQPVLGAKTCGVVTLDLSPGAPPEHAFVVPPGMAQLTLLEDLPDPYH
jgi:3',5'-cyclic AMP phosphodiesterase CpdA